MEQPVMNQSLSGAISAYRMGATQVHPMVAVVKLFDEVLRRIRMTIRDTQARKMEDAYINISRASLILRGLAGNLRIEADGDLVTTLQNTYFQNMIAMHTSFGKPDAVERYGRIIAGLTELRNTWAEIAGMPAVALPTESAEAPEAAARKTAAR
jgi:flagellar secretion chaperone FliS